jgi:hypothetical protein
MAVLVRKVSRDTDQSSRCRRYSRGTATDLPGEGNVLVIAVSVNVEVAVIGVMY